MLEVIYIITVIVIIIVVSILFYFLKRLVHQGVCVAKPKISEVYTFSQLKKKQAQLISS